MAKSEKPSQKDRLAALVASIGERTKLVSPGKTGAVKVTAELKRVPKWGRDWDNPDDPGKAVELTETAGKAFISAAVAGCGPYFVFNLTSVVQDIEAGALMARADGDVERVSKAIFFAKGVGDANFPTYRLTWAETMLSKPEVCVSLLEAANEAEYRAKK